MKHIKEMKQGDDYEEKVEQTICRQTFIRNNL